MHTPSSRKSGGPLKKRFFWEKTSLKHSIFDSNWNSRIFQKWPKSIKKLLKLNQIGGGAPNLIVFDYFFNTFWSFFKILEFLIWIKNRLFEWRFFKYVLVFLLVFFGWAYHILSGNHQSLGWRHDGPTILTAVVMLSEVGSFGGGSVHFRNTARKINQQFELYFFIFFGIFLYFLIFFGIFLVFLFYFLLILVFFLYFFLFFGYFLVFFMYFLLFFGIFLVGVAWVDLPYHFF